jgi:hypothetical protein
MLTSGQCGAVESLTAFADKLYGGIALVFNLFLKFRSFIFILSEFLFYRFLAVECQYDLRDECVLPLFRHKKYGRIFPAE